jgi:hypothetical protein
VASVILVAGRHPLHRIASPYPLLIACSGFPVVAGTERRVEVNLARRDLCRTCFPRPKRAIRLGAIQRALVRRALASTAHAIYIGKREVAAFRSLSRRGILKPVPGLPRVYQIASPSLVGPLKSSLRQHQEG